VFHYVRSIRRPWAPFGYAGGELPVTESSSDRLLRLPCYYRMTRADQDRVIEGITSFFGTA